MPNTVDLLRAPAQADAQSRVVAGYVSTLKPAPAAFGDPVYVVMPGHSTEISVPCSWAEIHATAKPAQGAEVLVAFDENNVPVVVWWAGANTPGPASGDLSNSYPGPSVIRPDLQAGVLGTAGSTGYSSVSVNSSTGAITFTPAADTVWVGTPLIRGEIANTATTVTPATLPAASKYKAIALEMTAPTAGDGNIAWTSSVGADQTSQANALANPPALNSTRVRLADVIVLNTAGVFSLATTRDRRTWARGAQALMTKTDANATRSLTSFAAIDTATLQARLELTGVPVRVSLCTGFEVDLANVQIGLDVSTSLLGGAAAMLAQRYYNPGPATEQDTAVWETPWVPSAAGSWLLTAQFASGSSGRVATAYASAAKPLLFTVREIVSQNANNGTS